MTCCNHPCCEDFREQLRDLNEQVRQIAVQIGAQTAISAYRIAEEDREHQRHRLADCLQKLNNSRKSKSPKARDGVATT